VWSIEKGRCYHSHQRTAGSDTELVLSIALPILALIMQNRFRLKTLPPHLSGMTCRELRYQSPSNAPRCHVILVVGIGIQKRLTYGYDYTAQDMEQEVTLRRMPSGLIADRRRLFEVRRQGLAFGRSSAFTVRIPNMAYGCWSWRPRTARHKHSITYHDLPQCYMPWIVTYYEHNIVHFISMTRNMVTRPQLFTASKNRAARLGDPRLAELLGQ
jgi:hypothetical protein